MLEEVGHPPEPPHEESDGESPSPGRDAGRAVRLVRAADTLRRTAADLARSLHLREETVPLGDPRADALARTADDLAATVAGLAEEVERIAGIPRRG